MGYKDVRTEVCGECAAWEHRVESSGASRSPGLSRDSWPAASPGLTGQAAPPYTPPGSEDRRWPGNGNLLAPLQAVVQTAAGSCSGLAGVAGP